MEETFLKSRSAKSLCRLHLIGGPGSGKSTLAHQLGACLGLPVYSLDMIAFEGVDYAKRPLDAIKNDVHRIVMQPGWITEGIFLGWTDEILKTADAIIWLDHVRWEDARWRILFRFARGAMEEASRQPGLQKVNRFRDYARNLRQLIGVMHSSKTYYMTSANSNGHLDEPYSRSATSHFLTSYADKVVHCQREEEIQEFLNQVSGRNSKLATRRELENDHKD